MVVVRKGEGKQGDDSEHTVYSYFGSHNTQVSVVCVHIILYRFNMSV